MGVKVQFDKHAVVGERCYRPGAIIDTTRGVADVLVNRRHVAHFIMGDEIESLVPLAPGLGHAMTTMQKLARRDKGK